MKKPLHKISFTLIALCLVSALPAKIHYVKQDGTGDGSSWEQASNSIKKMMYEAKRGDSVWVAAGIYCPELDPHQLSGYTEFQIKNGVHLYGGFQGTETGIDQRELHDRDGNGTVEAWEYKHETIITGEKDGIADVWEKETDAEGNWKWKVSGYEGNSSYLVSLEPMANVMTDFNGFTVSGGYLNNLSEYNRQRILVEVSRRMQVRNCVFTKNIINIQQVAHDETQANYSILELMAESNNNSLENCLIENNATFSVYKPKNEVDSILHACDIIHTAGANMANVVIRNNSVSAVEHTSIVWNQTFGVMSNCEVYGNAVHISHNKGAIVYSGGSNKTYNTIVRDNIINSRNGGSAVWVTSMARAMNNLVYNNRITAELDAVGGGMYVETNSWLINNVVSNNTLLSKKGNAYGAGIGVADEDTKSAVINCIITGNSAQSPEGTSFAGGLYDNRSKEVVNFTVQNCAVSNNEAATSPDMQANQYYKDMISPSVQSIFAVPVTFRGAAKNESEKAEIGAADWHPASNSPCLGSGASNYFVTSYLPKVDMDGNTRVVANSMDMGVYQISSPTSIDPEKQNSISYRISEDGILEFDADISVTVYNVSGKAVSGGSADNIRLPERGIYIIRISGGNTSGSFKVIW